LFRSLSSRTNINRSWSRSRKWKFFIISSITKSLLIRIWFILWHFWIIFWTGWNYFNIICQFFLCAKTSSNNSRFYTNMCKSRLIILIINILLIISWSCLRSYPFFSPKFMRGSSFKFIFVMNILIWSRCPLSHNDILS
jgi:hypothetical protein